MRLLLGTAREVMRKAIAWNEIAKDKRLATATHQRASCRCGREGKDQQGRGPEGGAHGVEPHPLSR